ncbi:coiled-coil domain-containing protein R3HCC1L isoform X2 [Momordica charantia]|uniref:Coiled-coil domain-containing protein R3HCC1L isoform X2 n=1 Tax=Momordica charantia TaxID=3673 RepID=A0A6J1CK33_MOMCH|nr:coiled-coil domain-containing protein R3HCC1L isoform X2 [Momordica charantia]
MEKVEEEQQRQRSNWSELVEDLVTAGDIESAISLLQSVISGLQTLNDCNRDPQLAAALSDLSTLYSSKGFSLKADDIATKALVLKQQTQVSSPAGYGKTVKGDRTSSANVSSASRGSVGGASVATDWEAIADRSPNELISLQSSPNELLSLKREPDGTGLSVRETKDQTPRRRGRGTFSYKKDELYSDKLSDSSTIKDTKAEDATHGLEEGRRELKSAQYGTQHVLVLTDFPLSTKTMDLERLLGNFMNSGVAIRWVNDTTALAVFQTPSAALEALNHVRSPFTVHVLDENDPLLRSIRPRDLEPPKQRPKTCTRAAQRMIAQGIGVKLPTPDFGLKELRKQEEDRKNRIVTRQKLRDEAWGEDGPS